MKTNLIENDVYQFELTDKEVIRRIHECLRTTNPELRRSHIKRSPTAREYKAYFIKKDGFETKISIGISQLKRFFGAFILGFTDDGISFRRIWKKHH